MEITGISNRDMESQNAHAQGRIQKYLDKLIRQNLKTTFRCGKTYSRAQSMLFHVNKHEENEMKFFQCNHCQSRFKKKEKLDQHIQKKHSGGFECETCGKKFPEQSSLKEHMRVCANKFPSTSLTRCSGAHKGEASPVHRVWSNFQFSVNLHCSQVWILQLSM